MRGMMWFFVAMVMGFFFLALSFDASADEPVTCTQLLLPAKRECQTQRFADRMAEARRMTERNRPEKEKRAIDRAVKAARLQKRIDDAVKKALED